jgi:hypothetical protein
MRRTESAAFADAPTEQAAQSQCLVTTEAEAVRNAVSIFRRNGTKGTLEAGEREHALGRMRPTECALCTHTDMGFPPLPCRVFVLW